MKKRLSIIMTSLAVMLTMMAVGIHHHHHGEMMCLLPQELATGFDQQGKGQDDMETSDHSQRFLAADWVKIAAPMMQQADVFHGSIPTLAAVLPTSHGGVFAVPSTFVGHSGYPHLIHSWITHSLGFRAPPAC